MKYVLLTATVSLMMACSPSSFTSVSDTAPGIKGVKGDSGTNGQDGYSLVSSSTNNPELCGAAGGVNVFIALDKNRDLLYNAGDDVQTQFLVCNGSRGTTGSTGASGANGMAGASCSVSKVGTASTIKCGNSSVVVNDGATGNSGSNGRDGTSAQGIWITEIVNVCGVEFNNDEVFMRLSNGRLLGVYDGGPNEDRLALLAPGNYRTTDSTANSSCTFTITNDYKIINEHRNTEN